METHTQMQQKEIERVFTVMDRLSVDLRDFDEFFFADDDDSTLAAQFGDEVVAVNHALAHFRRCVLRTAARQGVRVSAKFLEPAGR